MPHADRLFVLDHTDLIDDLAATDRLLIIQDLDGVCMGLVGDPLTRSIEPRYVEAAGQLDGQFYVLTNGEHIGSRGVNGIIDKALEHPTRAQQHGLYLPGLAAGGVQFQDRHGRVSHPGVSADELAFLSTVPARAVRFLADLLASPPFALDADDIDALVDVTVLDNIASPTVNINPLHQRFGAQPERYRQLQRALEAFMDSLLQEAEAVGLADAFFVHYAPNQGRGPDARELVRDGDDGNAGTTDFQFMIRGAVKETGVLVILNHYYFQHTGHYPLGEAFNARQAPRDHYALLGLAKSSFDPAHMPRIVGVGDTVSSSAHTRDGQSLRLRGGSDRGFLTLVQALGETFGTGNIVAYVDSSGGEVRRPGLDATHLQRCAADPTLSPWPAVEGITDAADPLRLNVVFCGGHAQYVPFFCTLAARRGAGRTDIARPAPISGSRARRDSA
ncbi:glucosylglycerol 3-phosphatase [Azoarcus sp. L1K30]|uniref:glucosylglycerol 3-phosphatase n=1 Tax=Azoarcus sp. L1K30 TaxID=2820277 RepID=UPI001B82F8A9|nr:glucosylglycerol 3-phosphatase [Azoarcus sp. L1K30]MBR0565136.1 glucosylglycerol 3-phosphatase [Azoarcus sp. L1K30]